MQARALHEEILGCTSCAANLPLGARPIVQFSATSRILIIGQAPGRKVHESGVPWNDDSGKRLRGWLGLNEETFYDAARIALMPMGFCYPGARKGGDAPPRPECAPLWHDRIRALLRDVRLTLLVGAHAQRFYLPATRRLTMTERVGRAEEFAPAVPLPHPAWRSRLWMARHPWFEQETLPFLRKAVARQLG